MPLKHPVIFNAHRSFIVFADKSETQVLPLHIAKSSDYKSLEFGVKQMEGNLRNILRALERMKERQEIGVRSLTEQKLAQGEHLEFPNMLLQILFKIAEF